MNLVRCSNGHFYDSDKFSNCPHCNSSANNSRVNETVAFSQPSGNNQVTVSLDQSLSSEKTAPEAKRRVPSDEGKTVGFFSAQMGKEPVVGWLVCIKGSMRGEDFRLKTGRNFIGRNSAMDICLENETSVSRDKHAIVIYEPKANVFMAQPGESTELFYLNGKVVLSPIEIQKNDCLQIGEVEMMLIPCCDKEFSWNNSEK